ncbi:hypothetical protein CMUS01_13142 [Colletotrichum musicola]|uniref:Uncharacterized protein n=1 Tax=Colletotrichum musicola TaxID=2175873 RepID=A0A8H6JGI5_9PEZI|nr:hypothetical protein CMUS01_13142 [Colletotrichum musicola]
MEVNSTNALESAFVALLPSHVRHDSNRSPTFPAEIFEAISQTKASPSLISRHSDKRVDFLPPHLARAVRTVTWYELPGNESNLRLFHGPYPKWHPTYSDGPEPPKCRLKDWRNASYEHQELTWPDLSQEENVWRNKIFTDAASLFWWKLDVSCHIRWLFIVKYSGVASDEIAADFFPVFCDSLRAMPGLSTFVSEPMHPDRPLQHSADGYPFVAQLFQSHKPEPADKGFSGLHRFLQKAMVASRGWSGGPFIDELHLVHKKYHIDDTDGFDHLKRLHFCCLHEDLDRLATLCDILDASQNLTDLRLCFGYFSSIPNLNLETFRLEHGGGCRIHRTEPRADSILDKEAQTYEDGMFPDIDGLYDPENEHIDESESITEDEITAGQPVVPWEDDERPMYAREHMSQLRHLERFRAGGDEDLAMWKFKKRNGEEAWGEDPLEFWSDWEGSEAGDVREPVSPDWKAPALIPRKKKPLTRSFFSKWDERDKWDGRITRIDKYWEETIANKDIDIQPTGPNQPRPSHLRALPPERRVAEVHFWTTFNFKI